jgi:DNA repair protein RecO (recombination protein O)
MIIETEGIVLHTIKYSESSVISQIYTKEFGIGSYIMNNARATRSKMAFFQPLSIISINAYRKPHEKIHRIKEISFQEICVAISTNIYKSTISLFVGEVVKKLFREEEQHKEYYDYFKRFVLILEHEQTSYADFHILFLYQTSHFLGIFPQMNYSETEPFFDLHTGSFTSVFTDNCVDKTKSLLVLKVLECNSLDTILQINRIERKVLLQTIIEYYSIHIHKIGVVKSLEILETIFN